MDPLVVLRHNTTQNFFLVLLLNQRISTERNLVKRFWLQLVRTSFSARIVSKPLEHFEKASCFTSSDYGNFLDLNTTFHYEIPPILYLRKHFLLYQYASLRRCKHLCFRDGTIHNPLFYLLHVDYKWFRALHEPKEHISS